MNLTRGGLSPAKIINLSTQDEVPCMFNPFEYTISKQNSWERESTKGKNVPKHNFQKGEAKILSLTLHFDSLAEKRDVRDYTYKLWEMMLIDTQSIDDTTGKGAPPAVAFEWGRLYFEAIITSMKEKFSLFLSDGTPVRSTVDVTLEQHTDDTVYEPQMQGQGAGQGAPQTTTATEGDRVDNIASANNTDQRTIAEQNNVDDPMNIPPGTTLSV